MTKTLSRIIPTEISDAAFQVELDRIQESCLQNDLDFSRTQQRAAAHRAVPEALLRSLSSRFADGVEDLVPSYVRVDRLGALGDHLKNAAVFEILPRAASRRYRFILKVRR